MNYHTICPECKNDIKLAKESLREDDHFECPTCGITLEARDIDAGEIKKPEIVEMEK
jgi:DNA-directed RNA polymerase subunit RPC12/RpoP